MNKTSEWISAQQALDILQVKAQTLYAYVSRGLVRAVRDPEFSNRSLYSVHDVRALVDRKKKPRRREEIAASTLSWGEPVLESGLSTIKDGQLFFGDSNAVDLARSYDLETVAGLHWSGKCSLEKRFEVPLSTIGLAKQKGFACLAHLAGTATTSAGRSHDDLCLEASGILDCFVDALVGEIYCGRAHQRLAAAWRVPEEDADILRRALVLLSDHELNASTFAVRVAASTGASLGASVLAGFAAFSGPRHGEAGLSARKLLETARRAKGVKQALRSLYPGKPQEYGFGHKLYPAGDIRAACLFDAMTLEPDLAKVIAECEAETGEKANIDAALAVLALTLRLPREAAFILFAVGRMAGWLGHAIEQSTAGQLIRPRAKFVARVDS